MNCYLDSSALVKRYITEPGSQEIEHVFEVAEKVGTVSISRAEVTSAFAKAVRSGVVFADDAESARQRFYAEWRHFSRFRVSDFLVERACDLSWRYGLRGYDSVQLAAAQIWRETIDAPVVMVAFDTRLLESAGLLGLELYPRELPHPR
ncbi:MAG TPA: type II toxin-antitoxin system VapC family toxin [Thermoanaerobaculia bacterium]